MVNTIYVAYSDLGCQWDAGTWQSYLNMLPARFHPQISNYALWPDRQRSVIGKLLLQQVLLHFNYPVTLLDTLQLSKFGKPGFDNGLQFNITHSAGYILCAATTCTEVGIDIEKICPMERTDFTGVMSTAHWQKIDNAEDPVKEFYRYWTAKEAVAKAAGCGLSFPFDKIETDLSTANLDGKKWWLRELTSIDGYAAFVAAGAFIDNIDFVRMTY